MSQCRKFAPNIFNKSKCSNCFRQKEEHSAEALECNRASRAVARSGYLFVAPDWDFSVPLNRTKRWQRRWFVLYDDGELNYSVDEHPDTVPQGSVDMCKVLEVTGAEQVTGHPHSLALTSPDRVTFIKAASREDARWWAELLAVFPRRHKRNATFPGGRASPSLPQLGRSASPQPSRPRHLSCTGPSPRTNFITPPLKEERESPSKEDPSRPIWVPEPTNTMPIEQPPPVRTDYVLSSGSPPTRDKLQCEEKARARRDWRNERLRDIATALTDRSPESSLALPAEGLLHLKKGWLWIKDEQGDWSKSWVVLCGPTLSTYREQDEQGVPDVTIELSSVIGFNEVTTDSKYGFQIHWSGPTLTLSAVTAGIRTNWLQALKKAMPDTPDSPPAPATPRSILLSSDEEYRTASEGGRRGSEDWGDLPPSPPLVRTPLTRVKDRARSRPKLPRCQSRQSTVDSVSTDELDTAKETAEVEIRNTLNKQSAEIDDLKKQLSNAVNEVQNLESQLAKLKKSYSESMIREKQAEELLLTLERSERELNQRIQQSDEKHIREQRSLQRRITDAENAVRLHEDRYNSIHKELQTKQRIVSNLQDELNNANERLSRDRHENDLLYKRLQDMEGERSFKLKHVDSITDLTNIDLELDLENLTQNDLIEQCLDLRSRFEKAVIEIRALKRELREAHARFDDLELQNLNLQTSLEVAQQEGESHNAFMATRVQDLTNKLLAAEKQARTLKSKLQDSREKRRSLSLKGRESISINKEVEDKVSELEAKILALEKGRLKKKHKRERSSERASPIDDRSLRRIRRKSLDSATSSEPMKLLMRLSSLESKVLSVANSSESLNTLAVSASDSNLKQLEDSDSSKNENVESIIVVAKDKLKECLCHLSLLKGSKSRRSASPGMDRLSLLERCLNDLGDVLNTRNMNSSEIEVVKASVGTVVKHFENLLREKLNDLNDQKRLLQENGKLDDNARLQILAEKFAFENILVSRIQESLSTPTMTDAGCDRLLKKELIETSQLSSCLQAKINGNMQKQPPKCKTSIEYLTKILAKRLLTVARGLGKNQKVVRYFAPIFKCLKEKQTQIDVALNTYKATKLPQLADALATETLSLASDTTCRLRGLDRNTTNEVWRIARETVNTELIQSEINHILMRAAQIYETASSSDHNFFFSFFASERAALELWSDSVEDLLRSEMQKNIDELNDQYQNSLNKLQRQNWRRRVESERITALANGLLTEYADIVAHKTLIDARISVLCGEYKQTNFENVDSRDSFVADLLENEKLWNNLENSGLVQISQSLEAEFKCMLNNSSSDCSSIIEQFDVEQVKGLLSKLAVAISEIQKCVGIDGSIEVADIRSWQDICQECVVLQERLTSVQDAIIHWKSQKITSVNEEERRPVHLGTEYLSQVENLRAAYRRTIAVCEGHRQQAELEQLQVLCERVLVAMEHWHRKALQDLRESHTCELLALRQDKEQALAEETQATLAALDAMRKAHEAEVQREVAKFKQEFARQQQNELLELTERLSVKCLEAAALEEQLGSATRQLAHAQHHILQLERNPQLS